MELPGAAEQSIGGWAIFSTPRHTHFMVYNIMMMCTVARLQRWDLAFFLPLYHYSRFSIRPVALCAIALF